MRQKNNPGYREVISMEEYLVKRKKIKEKEQDKGKKKKNMINPMWEFEEYIFL